MACIYGHMATELSADTADNDAYCHNIQAADRNQGVQNAAVHTGLTPLLVHDLPEALA